MVTAWGREDLITLLHGIKENIPKGDMSIYTKGERTLEWDKVAFGPYSPQMCHQKWKELSKKVGDFWPRNPSLVPDLLHSIAELAIQH